MHEIKQPEQKRHYLPPAAEAARIMEAVKLGKYATAEHLSFCLGMAHEYGCRPLESDKQNFYSFLCTIYRYGQVQGIRSERARRKKRGGTRGKSAHSMRALTDEELRDVMKGEAGRLDIQTTFDYFSDLVEADVEETEGHSILEKMMWTVRHAHLNGFRKALENYNDMVREALES